MSSGDERLGLEFEADYAPDDLAEDLRSRLPDLRGLPGFPAGTDEAIADMSAPPAHTACPNPYLRDWVEQHRNDDKRPDSGPFATDSQAGKTSLTYKAHAYPTKVPHEAILRLILHYTEPGDIVLDGFCGTGMVGVAAQLCGSADETLKAEIEAEMGQVSWGTRRAVLQDLAPSATFIAAGLNLPVDGHAFDQASTAILDRFDAEYGWMYETELDDGTICPIEYTVWSEVRTCPHCGAGVNMYEAAHDPTSGAFAEEFPCPNCGAVLTKRRMEKRRRKTSTPLGDVAERTEFAPMAVVFQGSAGRESKAVGDFDLQVLERCRRLAAPSAPNVPLPYLHMTHERSSISADGFRRLHHFYTDRALVALSALWGSASEE